MAMSREDIVQALLAQYGDSGGLAGGGLAGGPAPSSDSRGGFSLGPQGPFSDVQVDTSLAPSESRGPPGPFSGVNTPADLGPVVSAPAPSPTAGIPAASAPSRGAQAPDSFVSRGFSDPPFGNLATFGGFVPSLGFSPLGNLSTFGGFVPSHATPDQNPPLVGGLPPTGVSFTGSPFGRGAAVNAPVGRRPAVPAPSAIRAPWMLPTTRVLAPASTTLAVWAARAIRGARPAAEASPGATPAATVVRAPVTVPARQAAFRSAISPSRGSPTKLLRHPKLAPEAPSEAPAPAEDESLADSLGAYAEAAPSDMAAAASYGGLSGDYGSFGGLGGFDGFGAQGGFDGFGAGQGGFGGGFDGFGAGQDGFGAGQDGFGAGEDGFGGEDGGFDGGEGGGAGGGEDGGGEDGGGGGGDDDDGGGGDDGDDE